MVNIVLQSQDLTNTANKINSSADELKASLNKIDNLMSDIDSVWSDQNSKTYLERYEELKREFPQFEASVRSYGTFLNTVVDTYKREFIDDVAGSFDPRG